MDCGHALEINGDFVKSFPNDSQGVTRGGQSFREITSVRNADAPALIERHCQRVLADNPNRREFYLHTASLPSWLLLNSRNFSAMSSPIHLEYRPGSLARIQTRSPSPSAPAVW